MTILNLDKFKSNIKLLKVKKETSISTSPELWLRLCRTENKIMVWESLLYIIILLLYSFQNSKHNINSSAFLDGACLSSM